jgi:hypothetical protein
MDSSWWVGSELGSARCPADKQGCPHVCMRVPTPTHVLGHLCVSILRAENTLTCMHACVDED